MVPDFFSGDDKQGEKCSPAIQMGRGMCNHPSYLRQLEILS